MTIFKLETFYQRPVQHSPLHKATNVGATHYYTGSRLSLKMEETNF